MIPTTIKKRHVLRALEDIQKNGVPRGRQSHKYELLWEGRRYPPKYTVALAARFATGTMLDSEAFGGGKETNSFLGKLGFTIAVKGSAPQRPRSAVREPARSLRVARARLGLGMSMTAFKALDPHRWTAHKKVVERQFKASPAGYRKRIRALVARGVEAGAQVVVLPACALAHETPRQLKSYLGDEVLLAAGAYDVRRGREFALVRRPDGVEERFDDQVVQWLGVGGYSVMAAISSTVAKLQEHEPTVRSKAAPPSPTTPQLILDMGHHPYSSRYLFNTLRCVSEQVTHRLKQPAVTVLSAWRYPHGRMSVPWAQPTARVTWDAGEEDAAGDTLDILDLVLS